MNTNQNMTMATVTAIKSMMEFDRYFHQRDRERDNRLFTDQGIDEVYLSSKRYDDDTNHMLALASYAVQSCKDAGLDPQEMVFSCVNFIEHFGDQ